MPAIQMKFKGRSLRLSKCMISPDLETPTILVHDLWDYVEMWLKRSGLDDALFFWRQAEAFYRATKTLPDTSAPLTGYYSAMNAAKTLLVARKIAHSPFHGLSGGGSPSKASLGGEYSEIKGAGVFPSLCKHLGEPSVKRTRHSLKDILYNIPYVHRAYTVTFTSRGNLFTPIKNPVFCRQVGSNNCWLAFEVKDTRDQKAARIATWDNCEHDIGVLDRFVVRRRDRFKWRDTDVDTSNIQRFKNYYQKVRRSMLYIRGSARNWYVKRTRPTAGVIARSSLTLTLMAMHRLSELARYNPDRLARHFDSQHNWLLTEFINLSLDHFIDEIAAEITGHEFMPPGYQS